MRWRFGLRTHATHASAGSHRIPERGHPGRSTSGVPGDFLSAPSVWTRCGQEGRAPLWLRHRHARKALLKSALSGSTPCHAERPETRPHSWKRDAHSREHTRASPPGFRGFTPGNRDGPHGFGPHSRFLFQRDFQSVGFSQNERAPIFDAVADSLLCAGLRLPCGHGGLPFHNARQVQDWADLVPVEPRIVACAA